MKKNISINISGIIFHIEEDGYDQLKNYLESINKYFASFEDSKEIIEDIENRIAEIFLSKLTDGNQVVTAEDVASLIATMGSISDFEAAEEQADFGQKIADDHESFESSSSASSTEEEPADTSERPKRLQRDTKRRLIGGVAAGLAHYFGIDPLWVRLIIIVLFFNLVFWVPVSGAILIAYIIMWIMLPASEQLKEDKNMKKMFRNADERVLGGVASGLAAYFGADVTLIRILFVVATILGGTGLILYIVLWIITPEAVSITDKIQMQGEPVTLSNIESNVKKGLNVEKEEDENLFVKILLFPFRLIAAVFTGLGKVLGPILLFLGEIIRVFAGIIVLLTAVGLIIAFSVSISVILGLLAGGDYFYLGNDIPIDLIKSSIPPFTVIAAYVAVLIPSLSLAILGATIIAKKKILNATTGWSLFGIWVLSLFSIGTTVPMIVKNFRVGGEYREVETFNLNGKTGVLDLNEVGFDEYDVTYLKIRGHSETDYKLVKSFEARGRSRQDAIQNAKMVEYSVIQEDSIIIFDSNFTFKEDSEFRAQELYMTLYIPYDTPFKMRYRLRHVLSNTLYHNGYNTNDLGDNTWMISDDEGLLCLTCDDGNYGRHSNKRGYEEDVITFDFKDFNEIIVNNNFDVEILKSDDYNIKLEGPQREIKRVRVEELGSSLEITMKRDYYFDSKRRKIKVEIKTPDLKGAYLGGSTNTTISGFTAEDFDIRLSGNAEADVNISAERLSLDMGGSSRLNLEGQGSEMEADISGAAKFDAFDYRAANVDLSTSGASNSRVYASENLDIDSGGASTVRYKGNANVNTKSSGASRAERE
ncbi:PspC domain-containing protein [Fulvivirgaceae bacterium BMA12]|uniref:PspC domain-containing protein n=1 Tax=Agaribacillus aureus TaxID=3051825 RepID=A0ABT8LCD6_9BACT|nr:PspC domain-containing protein [Fulvivirgaceae bacterium BMA12]